MFLDLLLAAALAFQADSCAADLAAGNLAFAAHDYRKAAESFRAAAARSKEDGAEDHLTLDALRLLARVSRLEERPDEAVEALKRAAPIVASFYGGSSLELAAILSDLSGAQRASGNRKEAKLSLESAIRMREERPAEQAAELAGDLASAAGIELELENHDVAKELLTRALAASDRAFPPDSQQSLPVLDALAGVLRDDSEYSAAEPLYARALHLREAAFGPGSAELISTLDSLAYVYFGMESYERAQPVYERLLSLWETTAGPDHPMVALTLDKMSEFFATQGRNEEAEPLAARATAMRTKTLIESLSRTGRFRVAESKLTEAEEIYRRTVSLADEMNAPADLVNPVLRAHSKVLRALDRGEEADLIEQRIRKVSPKP
jgi:tetratricopeptide (TPR) repeat protein